jgi:hypothetical protein
MDILTTQDLSVEYGQDGFAFQLSHQLTPALGESNQSTRQVALAYLGAAANRRYFPIGA